MVVVTAEELFEKIKEIPESLRRYVKIVMTTEYHRKYCDVDGLMEMDELEVRNDCIVLGSVGLDQEIENIQSQIDYEIGDTEKLLNAMEKVLIEHKG
jgi:hypothetical protein